MVFPTIMPANSVSGGYEIDNSLRFNDGDSPKLAKTLSSAGNRKTYTISTWVKRGLISENTCILDIYSSDSAFLIFIIHHSNNSLLLYQNESGTDYGYQTDAVFRDPSAWYHIVLAVDTTQSTAANRVILYVNGSEVSFDQNYGEFPQNFDTRVNNTVEHRIGTYTDISRFNDGYMAEYHFIEGSAKAPTDFGEFDDNGVWVPIKYDGTYGTNGYYLEFKQTGTDTNASGIGADTSGNDNHFAVTNLTALDVTTDTPTNNFATFNSILPHTQTLSEGNTKVSNATTTPSLTTLGVSSGKWYAEIKFVSGTHCRIGWANENGVNAEFIGANSWIKINGQIFYHDNTAINSQGQAISAGDTIIMAVDVDAGKLWWGKNGTWDDNASGTGVPANGTNPTYTDTGISDGGFIFFGVASGSGAIVYEANFGNPPYAISSSNADANGHGNFEYAVPSGYFAICTKNLAEFG